MHFGNPSQSVWLIEHDLVVYLRRLYNYNFFLSENHWWVNIGHLICFTIIVGFLNIRVVCCADEKEAPGWMHELLSCCICNELG
jgi:hypothetical protein